jgi:hypothetical protein
VFEKLLLHSIWALPGKRFLISYSSTWNITLYREHHFARELRVEQSKHSESVKKIFRNIMLSFRWQYWYFLIFVNNYVIDNISNLKTNVESVPDKSCESAIHDITDNVQLQQGTVNQSLSRTFEETQICFLVVQVAWKSEIHRRTFFLFNHN